MKLFTWFGKSMEENPGEPSALRLVMVLGVLGVVLVWLIVSISQLQLVEIPGSVLGFVGSLLTAKFLQKTSETKAAATEGKTP